MSKKNPKKSPQFPEFKFKNGEGAQYKIIWKVPGRHWMADGLCDDPTSKNPEIWINPNIDEKRLLEIALEETFHAFAFDKNEKTARRFASTMKRLIYKLGWRKF